LKIIYNENGSVLAFWKLHILTVVA